MTGRILWFLLSYRLTDSQASGGNLKIAGDPAKLGIELSDETVADISSRHGILCAPDRDGSPSWHHLISHERDLLLACDYFTAETFLLQPRYVFFYIDLGSRRAHFAGCTEHQNSAWVNQQACGDRLLDFVLGKFQGWFSGSGRVAQG